MDLGILLRVVNSCCPVLTLLMKTLRLILNDQLSHGLSTLQDCDPREDLVLMCELEESFRHVKHHKKKIAFILSAMRHFAAQLEAKGLPLRYIKLDEEGNTGSLRTELARVVKASGVQRIVVTQPSEYHVFKEIQSWEKRWGISVEIDPDERFLCLPESFAGWARGRKKLRMEYFYREMRRQYRVLMRGEDPEGGQWNYDSENRKSPKSGLRIPEPYVNDPDKITREVMALVQARFGDHFGDLEPFYFAVTRAQALDALQLFIKKRLPYFGDYQDAMLQNEPWMYHSQLSFYLNCGLLLPLECIQAAEEAYQKGQAPLNAAEGFIRQLMGWREYVRGIYWLKMPRYVTENFFETKRALPEFYWTAKTQMNCLRQCVQETRQHAYAHHIQRLMVLGNFALIAGIDPAQVNEWFWIVYADAYEWVELPNVSGMILFADGGYLASKPYASGGAYINKMSDYCRHCVYKVSQKSGPSACPFNYLYWDFLVRNREKLQSNPRIAMMYRTYDRMDASKKEALAHDSQRFLERLGSE